MEKKALFMRHASPTGPVIAEAKQTSQFKAACNALHTVLCALFGERKPADRVLAAFFRDNPRFGSRDRRLIGEIVYAGLRNWGVLRLRLDSLEALESGKRGPTSAELAKLAAESVYLAGIDFPAARIAHLSLPRDAATREKRAELLLGRPLPDAAELIPAWIAGHLEPDFPLSAYLDKLGERPPMWLRGQTADREALLKELAGSGLAVRPHEHVPDALAVSGAQVNLYTLPAYREGKFEVQDLASQCIGLAAAPSPGERWLDACAGAGGKSLQMAALMHSRGTVLATDIREYKLEDLRKRARRSGFSNIRTRAWDGKALRPQFRQSFDGVLVDAPCSCSGVWRRNPDGLWTAREEAVAETVLLQQRILEAVASGVRPGGVLVYATCSIFREENRAQVEAFLAGHPEFVQERFPHPLTGKMTPDGMLQITPADADCDAMFVARMRKLKGIR